MGYITPAYAKIMLEWHTRCFHEFELIPQNIHDAPYRCRECAHEIKDGQEVMFFVVGLETDSDHVVSERRGYGIYLVQHIRCPV